VGVYLTVNSVRSPFHQFLKRARPHEGFAAFFFFEICVRRVPNYIVDGEIVYLYARCGICNLYIHIRTEHLYQWIMYCIHACRVEGVVYVHMRVIPSM